MIINNNKNNLESSIKYPTSRDGFTLVEMLLFLVIFSGLLVMLTSLFTTSLDVQKEAEATSNVQQDASYIISRLTHDIARATSITIPATLGDQSNTLVLIINGISYSYALGNNNLTLTDDIDTNQLNSYDTTISNLTFKRLGNTNGKNTIQINVTVVSKVLRRNGYETKTLQTTQGLR